jgi:hypothetical protein
MKKRLVLYGMLALAVLLVAWWRLGLDGGVTLLGYNRIADGMTMAEMDEVLGEPNQPAPWPYGTPIRVPNQGCAQHWLGKAGIIIVYYDSDGLVAGKEWIWILRERFELWRLGPI